MWDSQNYEPGLERAYIRENLPQLYENGSPKIS